MSGERGVAAMVKKPKKLDEGAIPGNPVVIPLNPDELIYTERRQEIEAVRITKEKINVITRVRNCADRSKKIYI